MSRTAAAHSPQGVGPPVEVDPQRVREILAKHGRGRGELITALQDLQTEYGYLPQEALRMVADETGRSLVDIYGIATFYRGFALEPRGRHVVSACLGTACHVRGAARVVDELERQLGVRAGETTADREFTLETVNCLGACALGPVVVIDGHYFSKVKTSKVRQLLDEASAGFARAPAGGDGRSFPIDVSCPRCNHSLMDQGFPVDGRPSVRCSVAFDGGYGWVRLSSVYGSSSLAADPDVPAAAVACFFCPHCHAPLAGRSACPACEAPMVPMMVRGGGILQICSRRGCENRMLDIT
jgi:NADH-quinone oxidoreductase subunit E